MNLQISKLYRMFSNMLILTHIFACLFYFAARYENFSPQTWVFKKDMIGETIGTIYINCYYWAI